MMKKRDEGWRKPDRRGGASLYHHSYLSSLIKRLVVVPPTNTTISSSRIPSRHDPYLTDAGSYDKTY